ncbi:MAG: glycoside hydrolase [Planctomycetes bacterium]|nr:glycoside hydrolase [Planctomycetota bacterium]
MRTSHDYEGKPAKSAERDLATPPAVPNFSPGPEYADNARKYQGVQGLERASNGRLWAAWYTGGRDEDRHNYVMLTTSGDDGKSWQTVLVLDPDSDGPLRAWDPCLWHDPSGKLWLFWAQERMGPVDMGHNKRGIGTIATFAITTSDSGKAAPEWSKPRLVSHGVMLNKPTVTSKGQWLMPIATWGGRLSDRVVTTPDQGATFTELGATGSPDVNTRAADEHIIIERKDGSLWMLVRGNFRRDDKPATYIGESVSRDGGKTWTDVVPSTIPHPITRFCIRRLASGRLLLVRNNPPDGKTRSHLTAFLSDDDGKTWKGGLLIDDRDQVSYPDLVQAGDGSVYLIYDRERRGAREILMAVFTEKDVLEGKPTSTESRMRVLVNRATGNRFAK